MDGDGKMKEKEAVLKMQEYIRAHYRDENFCAADVCSAVGYSKRQVNRFFKKYFDKTLREYINALCLTESADELLNTKKPILEVALNSHFESHEGFSRSFYKRFHIMPSAYRVKKVAVARFTPHPIGHYDLLLKHKEELSMNQELNLCMVTAKERKRRKLIYLPSRYARDYFSYCEEAGCEWEGFLSSIVEKMEPALLELPDSLVTPGFSKTAAGIEVPLDYEKELPQPYQIAELPECIMLYFQGEPYEREEDFCQAINSVSMAIKKYNPALYGYRFAYDAAPSFNFGANAATGARFAVPAQYADK